MLDNLLLGFETAISPENLLWCAIGVTLGTIIGMLPGLGASTGVAILIPLTLTMEPVTALIMLAGIYYGCQYGGTISSVLISTPGDASAVATTLDGYAMARKGRAGAALAIAAIGSFIAAIFSLIMLMLIAQPLAGIALKFGPAENLAIMVLALVTIISFSGDQMGKGVAMAGLGVLISTVGVASGFSDARFTFGQINLLSGVPFVEVMIGLFAVGEVLNQIHSGGEKPIRAGFKEMMITKNDLKRAKGAIGRGSVIGFFLGCLPGAGSTLASFIAYGVEKSVSPHRKEFGKGAIEGVAAPESANNAAANANFVPTLALGIPGGATTAVLLGAFVMYGLQPGPLLFDTQPALVWGLLVSFFFGNLILLILNLPLAPLFAQILRIPYYYLYPIILLCSLIGAFAIGNNTYSMWVVLVFGVLGYFLKRYDYPVAPLVLGVVLGPLIEKAVVQTSHAGDGSFAILFESPIAVGILIAAVALGVGPVIGRKIAANRRARKALAA